MTESEERNVGFNNFLSPFGEKNVSDDFIRRDVKPRELTSYDTDKEKYEERCDEIFNAWKRDRDDDKQRRDGYADKVTCFLVAQIFFIYVFFILGCSDNIGVEFSVECLGIIGAILAETFGVFYLVVKYFFGKRPEDLEKIGTFFLKCHPSRFGSNYRDCAAENRKRTNDENTPS